MPSYIHTIQTINGIKVKFPSGDADAPLYCRFDGVFSAQPASIDFYPSRKLLTAGYCDDTGGAVSGDVFHGTCIEFPVDPLVERSHLEWMMTQLVQEFLPDLHSEYSERWDGRNDQGILTEDGQCLVDIIERWVWDSSKDELADDPEDEYDADEED